MKITILGVSGRFKEVAERMGGVVYDAGVYGHTIDFEHVKIDCSDSTITFSRGEDGFILHNSQFEKILIQ